MDEQTYLELGETISRLTERGLQRRFGETGIVVVPCPGSESAATFPWQEPANELPWYWVFYPYLDAPEKQQESALNAGYIKVVSLDEADAVIAKLEKKLDLYKRGFKEDDRINAYLYAQLRHQKYRRCLAMASTCRLRARWFGDNFFYKKEQWALKWHKRWLELAERFK